MLTEDELIEKFRKKLKTLTNRQDSVETMSIWMLCYREYGNLFSKALLSYAEENANNIILSIYLINDVTQRANKYGWGEFRKEFGKILDPILGFFQKERSYKDIQSVEKIIMLWRSRGVFSPDIIEDIISKYGIGTLIKDLSPDKMVKYIQDLQDLCHILSDCHQALTQMVEADPECLFDNGTLGDYSDLPIVKGRLESLIQHLKISNNSIAVFGKYYDHIVHVARTILNWVSTVS